MTGGREVMPEQVECKTVGLTPPQPWLASCASNIRERFIM